MIENNQAIVLWKRCLAFIKDNVNTTAFTTWFEPIVPIKYEGKALTIGVPSPFFYEYLEEKYVDLLRTALCKEIGEGTELMYSIVTDNTNHIDIEMKGTERSAALPEAKPVYNGNKAPTLLQAPVVQDLDPHLNPNYNFENFIKGTSNEFSLTVAETVAQNPARTFNPLFLYGPSGVGKTHLINAIGTRIKELYPEKRVLYISAHLFQVQYTDSIRTNHFNDFITFYQQIDVLIIDDIQFLGGATQTQQEFFHTFTNLYNDSKQIIISSDRSPNDLKLLEERLRTRFCWGLTVNIYPPDFELRKEILRKKIIAGNFETEIPLDVIEYIASNMGSDVRQLEGSITRLVAYSTIMGGAKIDINLAIEALKDFISKGLSEKNDITRIQKIVAEYFQISVEDIRSKKRSSNISFPRQIAMYLCRKLTNESFPKIGTEFGGKDHSTVMHSVEKIEQEIKNNSDLASIIKKLENDLKP